MLILTSEIIIESLPPTPSEGGGAGKWVFAALNNCTIVEDMATLTYTCELLLPNKISWESPSTPEGGVKAEALNNFKLPKKEVIK